MRLKSVALAFALMAFAMAATPGIKIERKYKVGEHDRYSLALKLKTPAYDLDLDVKMTQTVRLIYPNGDADMETKIDSLKSGGQDVARPGDGKSMRLTKYGTLAGEGTEMTGLESIMVFSNALGDREINVGATYELGSSATSGAADRRVGTAKVESIENGLVKISSKMDVYQKGQAKSVHIESVATTEIATGKQKHIEGTIQGLNMGGAGDSSTIQSAAFKIDKM